MAEAKQCTVSFEDDRGVKHSVSVTAATLYTALDAALPAMREAGWCGYVEEAIAIEVEVRELPVVHTITRPKLQRWMKGASKSPADAALRVRIRELLGWFD